MVRLMAKRRNAIESKPDVSLPSLGLIYLARDELNLSGITAITIKENVGSQRLIEKLGLEFKKTILFGDEPEELLFYELIF